MKPNDLKQFLAICKKANVVPQIWGPQGIGKSQIVKQYAHENNLQFIDLRLSLMEPGDLMGMPIIERNKTVFKKPAWFPDEKTKGVLFLDELNRANEDILQAVFQLILDRRINDHILPNDWQIICAGNHGKDFLVNELDPALMNRFCHIHLEIDYDSWTEWAQNKLDSKLVQIITENRILHDKESSAFSVFDLNIKTTPRSWEMLNNLLVNGLQERIAKDVAYGLVNPKDADLITKAFFLKDYINLNVADVLEFNKNKLKKVAEHPNVIQICWNTNEELFKGLLARNYTPPALVNLLKYLEMLPDDVTYAFMQRIMKNVDVDTKNLNMFCYLQDADKNTNILNILLQRMEDGAKEASKKK